MSDTVKNYEFLRKEYLHNTLKLLRSRRKLLENISLYGEHVRYNPPQTFDIERIKTEVDSFLEAVWHKKTMDQALISVRNNLTAINIADQGSVTSEVKDLIVTNTHITKTVLGNTMTEEIELKLDELKKVCGNEMEKAKVAMSSHHHETEVNLMADGRLTQINRNLKKLNICRMLVQGMVAAYISEPDIIEEFLSSRGDFTLEDFTDTWRVNF